MKKVLVTLDEDLLTRLDEEASRAGETRSGFLAHLLERQLSQLADPDRTERIHRAIEDARALVAKYRVDEDATTTIRAMRDSR